MRAHLTLLLTSTLATLSCAVISAAPPAMDPQAQARATGDASRVEDPQVVAAVAALLERRRTGLTRSEERALAHTIVREARRQRLDPALVLAVMHVESRFNTFAMSPVGALGLMQILPSTGEEVARREGVAWRGAQTLFDPDVNVRLGVAYLRQLVNHYRGDVETALAAYNWGPGHIDRRIRKGRALPVVYPELVMAAHARKVL